MLLKEARRPLYESVREYLRKEYLNDPVGNALPSLRELSEKLDINHATISRALRDLEQEGIVEIVPRKGIFLRGRVGVPQEGVSVASISDVTAGKSARNIEMVVLYDNTHGQLDVARPIFSGMQWACERTNEAASTGAVSGTGLNDPEGASCTENIPMRLTHTAIPVSSSLDAGRFVTQARANGTVGVVFLGFGYLSFPESLVESRFIFEVSQQLPVVLAGTPHAQLPLDSVYCDPRPQLREYLDECYASGLRRYEFLGHGMSQPHQIERHEEFCSFLMSNGLTWNRKFLEDDSVEQLAARLRETSELPEVVVATNMSRATVMAMEAQRRGLRLPDDLKLLSFASLQQDAQPLLPYASILLMDEAKVGGTAWRRLHERVYNPHNWPRPQETKVKAPVVDRVPARFISRH